MTKTIQMRLPFEGSEQGTTIENLEPGTYTVNEIENPMLTYNELGEDSDDRSKSV